MFDDLGISCCLRVMKPFPQFPGVHDCQSNGLNSSGRIERPAKTQGQRSKTADAESSQACCLDFAGNSLSVVSFQSVTSDEGVYEPLGLENCTHQLLDVMSNSVALGRRRHVT